MRALVSLLLLGFTLAAAADDAGRRLYREGLLPSSEPVRARGAGGVVLAGAQAACANCHRRSGLGGGEGRSAVRPIAGRLLFAQPKPEKARAAALRGRDTRPPYTAATLARALREGIDPNGRPLDALMPRYELGEAELASLEAYLKELSARSDPGVSATEIHFATIVAPDADAAKSRAMLEILQAFFRDKNGGTRQEARRRASGEERMYRAYRTWVLHVWELAGPPDTWRAQLEARYRAQPVFAVLSGIGGGDWRPVHEFCERSEIPCLFPNVDFPVVSQAGHYPIYFSRGVALEADVLARHLAQARRDDPAMPIVQVYRDDGLGSVPAQTLREALLRHGVEAEGVKELPVFGAGAMTSSLWASLLKEQGRGALVLWLKESDLAGVAALGEGAPAPERLYLSASLASLRPPLPAHWLDKARFVSPFEPRAVEARGPSRMSVWLDARGIARTDARIQGDTFLAATLAGDVLASMVDNFSRDYFIERVEHMAEKTFFTGVYPRLSLGPGQRFASKGAYLAGLSADTPRRLVPLSEWIVP